MADENLTESVVGGGEAAVASAPVEVGERILKRNLFMFPLGTLGRDFLYSLFNTYLLMFILATKPEVAGDKVQYLMITVIMIVARIFDAFNDPIMGGIVSNTRTKWGKFKPWQLIGSVLTGAVIIAVFNVPLDGWAFIGFLAFGYIMFSVTFTMNDISYWGMMPTLTTNANDRNTLNSFTNIIVSIGNGLAGILIPNLTAGALASATFGSAKTAYGVIAILAAVLMVGFQLFTILGVKEKPLPVKMRKEPSMKLKDMFKVLLKNDQLLWSSLIMLIFSIGTNVVFAGLSTYYIYFEYGYQGILVTLFAVVYSVVSIIFTLSYPILAKKFGRDKVLYSTGIAIIVGYLVLMIAGLALPKHEISFAGNGIDEIFKSIGSSHPMGIAKFFIMTALYGIAGWGTGFYMIMVINMSNTVEYNEYKTGKRDESLIFSLRPLTSKLGSAITQGLASLVFIICGVLAYTKGMSKFEDMASMPIESGGILVATKDQGINNILAQVTGPNRMALLCCMCIIPAVFLAVALIIYKKKFHLDEKTLDHMILENEKRAKAAEIAALEEEVNLIPKLDEDGNPVLDEEGNPVLVERPVKLMVTLYDDGTPVIGEDGKPVTLVAPVSKSVPKVDEEGNPVLDEEGNPVMVDSEEKYLPQVDEEGNPVLDENGEVVLGPVPEGYGAPIPKPVEEPAKEETAEENSADEPVASEGAFEDTISSEEPADEVSENESAGDEPVQSDEVVEEAAADDAEEHAEEAVEEAVEGEEPQQSNEVAESTDSNADDIPQQSDEVTEEAVEGEEPQQSDEVTEVTE